MASSETSFNEPHYRIGELAGLWHCGRESLRLIFSREPGVVKLRGAEAKKHNIPNPCIRRSKGPSASAKY
jgi:hypothetical protein